MTRRHLIPLIVAAGAATALSPVAHAHPGQAGPTDGLVAGLAHPLSGPDHLLALLAVGLWASQLGRRPTRVLPATFLTAMALGGLLAALGATTGLAEPAILASVLALGALVALAPRMPLLAATALTAASALVHGYAHVAELPPGASAAVYSTGFLLTSAALVASGNLLGRGAAVLKKPALVRAAGATITAAALLLCLGVL